MSMYAYTFCHRVLCKVYSETSTIRTPLGPLSGLYGGILISVVLYVYMCTCQCEGYKIGQSNGVLLKEVSAFQRCPLTEVHCKQ